MRQALIEILEHQVVTPQQAAIELRERLGSDVTVFEARANLEQLAIDGYAERLTPRKGMTHYSAPSGGGYDPGGGAA